MEKGVTAPIVTAWGAPVVSVVVLVTFGTVVSLVLLRAIPAGSETVLNVLLGTLAAMATNVVGYWVGSSAGSARKDERLAEVVRGVVPAVAAASDAGRAA